MYETGGGWTNPAKEDCLKRCWFVYSYHTECAGDVRAQKWPSLIVEE